MKGPNYKLFKIISKITGFTENRSACCEFLNSKTLFTAEQGVNLKKTIKSSLNLWTENN